jgi:AcrR family transcriptional regulator
MAPAIVIQTDWSVYDWEVPRVRQEHKVRRRQQFIDAAWRCAAQNGHRDMTVDDVCLEARMSKGAFYGYFGQKRDLLLALLDDDAQELDIILERLAATSVNNTERLRGYTRALLQRGEEPGRVQVRADLWTSMLNEKEVAGRFSAGVQRRRNCLRGWIEAAVAEGEIVEVPANALASILLALSDGLMLHASIQPDAFRWKNIASALDVLLAGLVTKAAA